jgi:PAS domain S-box-containing protein
MSEIPLARTSQGHYALSWHSAQDGKVVVELNDLTIVDTNPAAEKMTGFARGELMGMELAALLPKADHERIRTELAVEHRGQFVYFASNILRKNGRLVPIRISSSGIVDLDGSPQLILELRDISGFLAAEQQISAQNWALSAFSVAAEALGQARTSNGLLQSICEAITAQSAYVLTWVGIADETPDKNIDVVAASGSGTEYLDGLQLSWDEDELLGQGPSGKCIRSGAIEMVEDTEESPMFAPWRDRARRYGIRSTVCIPLNVEGRGRGQLAVYSVLPRAFGADAVSVFERLASLTVRGIWALEQKKLLDAERESLVASQRHLAQALASSVFAMVAAMEARDPYTANHETRVGEIAVAIGREMGWSEDRLEGMRLAAMVHDVGKIGISSEILNKPGRLTKADYALVKEHPEIGYSILRNIPFTWPVADMVRQHHEKLDGSGYPLGLKAEEILPESKVLAVADIVEAMGSDRPYRASLGLNAALEEIESLAGTKLDAEAVRICCALFRERRLIVPGMSRESDGLVA